MPSSRRSTSRPRRRSPSPACSAPFPIWGMSDALKLFPQVGGQRHAPACLRVEAHLDGLLRRAVGHRVGLVQAHLVGEALGADAHHGALDEQQLPGADLVVELDRQGGDHRAQAARAYVLERQPGHARDVPAGIVEKGGVLAHVEVPVDVAVRRHDNAAVELEPVPVHGALILVCIFLALFFAAGATAGELEERVYAELQKRSLGPDALLIPDNLLRHEIAAPTAAPALVRELLARPLAAADAAAIFERSVPAALRELAALQPPPEAADFETLLARYVAARPKTSAEFLEATARFAQGLRAPGLEFPPPQVRETPLGRVSIGGPGPDRHGPHAALIVDPGGDDVYERAPPHPGSVSVIVDLAGDDRYGGADFARGAFSALIDFAGDDRYDMRSGLGAAREGVSLLLDLG